MMHAADIISSPRLLLGPGPSMVHPRVLRAMATPPVGHMDPQFFAIMDETQDLLRPLFQTTNRLTFTLPGTGSAGMEAALLNFLEAGDSALICVAGFYAERMVEIAGRATTDVRRVDAPWGQPIRPEQVEEALRATAGQARRYCPRRNVDRRAPTAGRHAEIAHRYRRVTLSRYRRFPRRCGDARRSDRRRHLLHRLAEMPQRPARPCTDHDQPARQEVLRARQDQGADLVSRSDAHREILGYRSGLPPHRADQHAICHAGGVAHGRRRGAACPLRASRRRRA